jgi:DNA-binding GntR family transcriptional regulator
MEILSKIRHISLREQVAEEIRTAIIEGRLRPNDHIPEIALTEQLGVSRTPVREALILLEREALVVSVPNRGCFVRAFNEEDVGNIFSMRTTLENFAAEIIIDKLTTKELDHLQDLIERQRSYVAQNDFKLLRSADMAFHQFLTSFSNHPMLMRSWQEIVAQVAALLYLRAEYYPNYDEFLAIRDHQGILDAYRVRNLDEVKAENLRINERVAGECREAVRHVAQAQLQEGAAKGATTRTALRSRIRA